MCITANAAPPPLDPPISDVAPADRNLTGHDQQHRVTYLRLLDADAEGADWQEIAKVALHIDPEREPDRTKRAWERPLAPRKVANRSGFRHLLRSGAPH
jgi:ABC-type cobalamin transport system ATPase subunit